MNNDPTRLTHWFPKLLEAGLPVPKTIIVQATDEELRAIWDSFEQQETKPAVDELAARVKAACDKLGYPAFLRTDHFSGKHDWDNTCFVKKPDDIRRHIMGIAYMWECINMVGAPTDVWVVREYLKVIPYGHFASYSNMPITKEFRFFVRDDEVLCYHPYWPPKSFGQGDAQTDPGFDYDAFCTPDSEAELKALASAAGKAVGGEWSVDLLETKRGWYITDMAEANKSYHWETCPRLPNPMAEMPKHEPRKRHDYSGLIAIE